MTGLLPARGAGFKKNSEFYFTGGSKSGKPSRMISLNPEQHQFWNNNHYILLKNTLQTQLIDSLLLWTEELYRWPEECGKWMKYFETGQRQESAQEKLLCRVENFIPYHNGFRHFLTDEKMMHIVSTLMGEEAVLFKEKINFKLPGGSGFTAHQDAPAFTTFGQKYHITLMVAIDVCTIENGCLEVVNGFNRTDILKQAEDGTMSADVVSSFEWSPVFMNPGDLLFFDSYLPHRSAANLSEGPRRALYITYNRQSEGNVRDDYFFQKRKFFPPEIERVPGAPLSKESLRYNLGNPIR
jgi:ectoine hydroxylase-related dioxygenase (phytanoyl-CoA dioxygenase family)